MRPAPTFLRLELVLTNSGPILGSWPTSTDKYPTEFDRRRIYTAAVAEIYTTASLHDPGRTRRMDRHSRSGDSLVGEEQ